MKRYSKTSLTIILLIVLSLLLTACQSRKKDPASEGKTQMTIGVVMNGPIDDKGWTTAHYEGFEAAKKEFGLNVIYKDSIRTDEKSVQVMEELIKNGAKIIFATSFGYGDHIMSICEKYPDVKFFHCAGIKESKNVATYMGRIYQMRYLAGIAAGMQTETNHIGYVAAMPIDEVVRGLNAFALGVRKANPNATIHVKWTNDWVDYPKERTAAINLFKNDNIDIVTYHQDTEAVIDAAKEMGKYAVGYHADKGKSYPETALTSAIWNWGPFYKKSIQSVIDGKFEGKHTWDGVDTGIVDIAPIAAFAKKGIKEKIAEEKEKLIKGEVEVFAGPIKDNTGTIRVKEGTKMSDREMLNSFNWFAEGIVIEDMGV